MRRNRYRVPSIFPLSNFSGLFFSLLTPTAFRCNKMLTELSCSSPLKDIRSSVQMPKLFSCDLALKGWKKVNLFFLCVWKILIVRPEKIHSVEQQGNRAEFRQFIVLEGKIQSEAALRCLVENLNSINNFHFYVKAF